MAKKNFSFEKRRRELDKKNKKEARKLLKEENKARAGLDTTVPDGQEAPETSPDSPPDAVRPVEPGANAPD